MRRTDEMDAHHLTRIPDALGQLVVLRAGPEVARGMVVAYGEDGGVA